MDELYFYNKKFFIYYFYWLHWVLVGTCGIQFLEQGTKALCIGSSES